MESAMDNLKVASESFVLEEFGSGPAALMGPLLLAVFLNCFLTGIVLSMATTLVTDGDRELEFSGLHPKYIVGTQVFMNALEMALNIASLYFYAIHPGNLTDEQPWTMSLQPCIASVVFCLATSFLVPRCWRATNKPLILFFILAIGILLAFGSGLAVTICSFLDHVALSAAFSQPQSSIAISMSLWLTSTAFLTLCIASILVFDAVRQKSSEAGAWAYRSTSTQRVLRRISQIVGETGAAVAVVSVLNLALYFGKSGTAYHFLAQYSIGATSTLTVLADLLERRSSHHLTASSSFALGTRHMQESLPKALDVKVDTVVERDAIDDMITVTNTDSGRLVWTNAVTV
ncbi:putative transmembrane protein [Favolaschia claudopus]|uniref:Transmembrane protein n=1 Tax=Favolaschia claudopus TaxID=2862362 RepID=A0AAW0CTX3_9AGAR